MARQFALARYTENGSLDINFDYDGKILSSFHNVISMGIESVYCDVVDDSIIVAGWAETSTGTHFALAMYDRHGKLDTTFGNNGLVLTDFSSTDFEMCNAMLLSEHGIVVAGVASKNALDQFALARYDLSGALDKSFDNDGKVLTDFTSSYTESITAMALDLKGRIVVAGEASTNQGMQFALARYNIDGSLDKTFDNDGKVLTNFTSTPQEGATSIAVDDKGRIIVAGWAETDEIDGYATVAIARYLDDGSLDKSFDNDGKVLAKFTSLMSAEANCMTVYKNKIYVGGMAETIDDINFMVLCYGENGKLDKNFANNGMLITDFNSSNIEYINTLTIDFSERLVVAGKANDMFALARYTTDGKPDKSFDNDGKVTTNFTSADFEEINGITIDSHDRIIVAGSANV